MNSSKAKALTIPRAKRSSMRQNPIFSALLVLVNLGVVLLAAYLAIDALDQTRRQNARTEQSLNRLSESLDKLGDNVARMRFAAPAAAAATAPVTAPATASSASGAQQPVHAEAAQAHTDSEKDDDNILAPGAFVDNNLRDPNAETGGSMITRTQALPGNLNYLVNNEATVGTLWGLLCDTLAERNSDDNTKYEPKMAKSWTVTDDGLEYAITLRDNAYWQKYTDPVTGLEVPAKKVTSDDFLFFWEAIQNLRIPAEALRTYYEDLAGIEIIDDHNFIVRWKHPYSMSESFTLGLQPLPRHYYRPDPSWDDEKFANEFIASPRNQWIVGTGPYKLVKWDKNSEVIMDADENYFGPKPYITTRRLRLIPDNSVSFLEFKRGDIDVYGLQPAQWLEETPEPDFQLVTPEIETANADSLAWDKRKKAGELPENYKFEKIQYVSQSYSYVGYNLQRPLFKDREVRTALTHLIDRERILSEVYLGLGEIISGPFISKSPYYNHDVAPLPFDVEKATQILKENGWEDTDGDGILDKDYDGSGKRKPFQFTFIIPSSSTTTRKTAAIMEQDFLKAKIKMDIKPIEWSVYTQLLEQRDFDVCSLGWVGSIEGDPYQIWHSSGASRKGSSNHIGYNSPEADKLIEEGRRTINKEKRYEIYRKLHKVIADDQPYTFLVAPTATIAQSKKFRNALVYKNGQMNSLLQWLPQSLRSTR